MSEPSREKRRQDLQARSFAFAVAILQFAEDLLRDGRCPSRIREQLAASGTSVGSNLAEARNASSRRDLAAKYAIARREAAESRYWLQLVVEAGFAQPARAEWLLKEAGEFVAILTTCILRLRNPPASSDR